MTNTTLPLYSATEDVENVVDFLAACGHQIVIVSMTEHGNRWRIVLLGSFDALTSLYDDLESFPGVICASRCFLDQNKIEV